MEENRMFTIYKWILKPKTLPYNKLQLIRGREIL